MSHKETVRQHDEKRLRHEATIFQLHQALSSQQASSKAQEALLTAEREASAVKAPLFQPKRHYHYRQLTTVLY